MGDPRASSGPETSTRPDPGPLNPEALPARPTPSYQEQQPPPGGPGRRGCQGARRLHCGLSRCPLRAHLSPSAPWVGAGPAAARGSPTYDSVRTYPQLLFGGQVEDRGSQDSDQGRTEGPCTRQDSPDPPGSCLPTPPLPRVTQAPFTAAALMPPNQHHVTSSGQGRVRRSHIRSRPTATPTLSHRPGRPAPQWGPVHRGGQTHGKSLR